MQISDKACTALGLRECHCVPLKIRLKVLAVKKSGINKNHTLPYW